MKAFTSDMASERMQKRWDAEYHAAVHENRDLLARLEANMNKDRALSIALDILSVLDGQALREMRVIGRGRQESIGRDNIARGIQEDPFLGLCLAQAAGAQMADRIEAGIADRQDLLVSMKGKLREVFQQDLPLSPPAPRSAMRP